MLLVVGMMGKIVAIVADSFNLASLSLWRRCHSRCVSDGSCHNLPNVAYAGS